MSTQKISLFGALKSAFSQYSEANKDSATGKVVGKVTAGIEKIYTASPKDVVDTIGKGVKAVASGTGKAASFVAHTSPADAVKIVKASYQTAKAKKEFLDDISKKASEHWDKQLAQSTAA